MLLNVYNDLLDATGLPGKTDSTVFGLSFNIQLPPGVSMKSAIKNECYIFYITCLE